MEPCRSGRSEVYEVGGEWIGLKVMGHATVRNYSEPVSYDPYAPREAEEPQPDYSPIKRPTTLGDVLRKLWAPIVASPPS